jgi:RecA/RadA recombinase
MKNIDFAKFYIEKGWQVLPLKAKDKKPLVPWKNGGSTDLSVIAHWFELWTDANIGIVTGKNSGIVVLDVDKKHGGEESLLRLTEENWVLPDTPISHTGGGGLHYIFLHPGFDISNSAGALGAGLDIRADGGQICAPPSVHETGNKYYWDEFFKPSKTTIAAMPMWMLEILMKPKENNAVVRMDGEVESYQAGTRNSSLTSLAGTMHKRNMTKETIYLALQSENERRCFPPLPEDEVKNIVESITTRYPSGKSLFGQKTVSIAIQKPTPANEGLMELKEILETPNSFVGTGLGNWDDKLGGLAKGYLTLLAARPGMGKTTIAMQIARNVAAGGKKALFISLEMMGSELWMKAALGISEISWRDYAVGEVPAGTKTRLQNEIIPELIRNLGDRLYIYDKDQNCTTTEMIDRIVDEQSPDLVIIDHLAYLSDENENEIKRLGMICRRLRTIAQKKNVALLLLHHANRATDDRKNTTKEPRMSDIRGSGEIEQAADIILMPYIPSNYDMQEEKPRVSITYVPIVKNRIGQAGLHLVFYFDGLGQWFYRKNELPERLLGQDNQ